MASGSPSDQLINHEVVEQMMGNVHVHDDNRDEEYYQSDEEQSYESDQYDYDDFYGFREGYFTREERRRAMDNEIQAEIEFEDRWRVVEMGLNMRAERAEMQELEAFQNMIEDNRGTPAATPVTAEATPVTAEEAKEGEDTCCICMVHVPDCKFTECSHPDFICKVCAHKIVNVRNDDGKICPLCRTAVTGYKILQISKPVEEEKAEVPDSWEDL